MKPLIISALLFLGVLGFGMTIAPVSVFAQENVDTCQASGGSWVDTTGDGYCNYSQGTCTDSASWFLGLPTWYKYLDMAVVNGHCEVVGPMAEVEEGAPSQIDWQKASGYVGLAVLEILLRVAAMIAVGFVIYGGFRYITSQGEPDSTKAARQTILNAVIGLVIALLATAIVSFIARSLTS